MSYVTLARNQNMWVLKAVLLFLHIFTGDGFFIKINRNLKSPSRKMISDKVVLMRKHPPGRVVKELQYFDVERDGSDIWRADKAVRLLSAGGCGVIPTDTSYSFVTPVSSREGIERILRIKGAESSKKPLSLLCPDLATIDKYTYGIDKQLFKMLKKNLPGPYTFILPASSDLPKMIYQDGKKKWKRSEIGVRIPDDPICQAIVEQIGEPLLCSSVAPDIDPDNDSDPAFLLCSAMEGDTWCKKVDFVIDGGERPFDGSTIYDLTDPSNSMTLLREGLGSSTLAQ